MNMIDFYEAGNMLLSFDEVDNPGYVYNDETWTYYGEPNTFPQFGMAIIMGSSG